MATKIELICALRDAEVPDDAEVVFRGDMDKQYPSVFYPITGLEIIKTIDVTIDPLGNGCSRRAVIRIL